MSDNRKLRRSCQTRIVRMTSCHLSMFMVSSSCTYRSIIVQQSHKSAKGTKSENRYVGSYMLRAKMNLDW